MIKPLVVILTLLLVSSYPTRMDCPCRPATNEEIPHGANEQVVYSLGTVRRIHGRVTYAADGEPVIGAVVEVYRYSDSDRELSPYSVAGVGTRDVACVTGSDGRFCFTNLQSGTYAMRIGTSSSAAGMNDAHIRITLDRRWWTAWWRSGKSLEIRLHPGT